MKKNVFTTFALILALGLAGTAFGAGWATDYADNTGVATITDSAGGPDLNITLSPNVGLDYASDGVVYNLTTFNQQGTRVYGATEDYEGLFVTKVDYTTTDALAVPAADVQFDETNWEALGGGEWPYTTTTTTQ